MIVRLVLGDQLNVRHSWWREQRDYVLCMRGFAAALQQAGHCVRHFRIDEAHNRQSFTTNLHEVARLVGTSELERMERRRHEWHAVSRRPGKRLRICSIVARRSAP
jgi:deoxyribodipyrimidine photolyase-related protein